MKRTAHIARTGRIAGTLAGGMLAAALLASPALADPPDGMGHPPMGGMGHPPMAGMGHPGMGGMMDGHDHGAMGRHPGGGHEYGPHNAAVHFLGMADFLGLDDTQRDRLRKLRDDWIEANSTNEERLEAAQADLGDMLAADTIDLKAVNEQLTIVGKVEGQLWRAFAAQLAAIKEMLTDDQRARLREHHRMGM